MAAFGEGPEGNGPDQAHAHALLAALAHGAARDAAGGAVGDQHDIRILHHLLLPAAFGGFDGVILGLQVLAMRLHGLRIDVKGIDHGAGAVRRGHVAGRGPGLGLEIGRGLAVAGLVHVHGLHHLPDQAVAQDHDGVAVACPAMSNASCVSVHGLLHGAGRAARSRR